MKNNIILLAACLLGLSGFAQSNPQILGLGISHFCDVEADERFLEKNPHLRAGAEAAEKQLAGILEVNSDPIVSIDVIGSSASSIYDETLSTVFNKMIRIVSWYDNESGYSNRLLELTKKVG